LSNIELPAPRIRYSIGSAAWSVASAEPHRSGGWVSALALSYQLVGSVGSLTPLAS
jgi:hypothetical protein